MVLGLLVDRPNVHLVVFSVWQTLLRVQVSYCGLSNLSIDATPSDESVGCTQDGYLHELLCNEWEQRRLAGLMIEENETLRRLDKPFGHVLQAAYHRAGKRIMNRATLSSTKMSFDPDKFHFGKVRPAEVLLCFDLWHEEITNVCGKTPAETTCSQQPLVSVRSFGSDACDLQNAASAVVMLQLRPVCRNHVLLVPDIHGSHPQVLNRRALFVGLAFAAHASHRMWFSFNSIGAGASVNHLHWQGFFPGSKRGERFPLESHLSKDGCIVAAASPKDHVSVWFIPRWPLQGWVFIWNQTEDMESTAPRTATGTSTGALQQNLAQIAAELSVVAMEFISRLQQHDIAHNVLIGGHGTRVFVFPRRIMNTQGVDASLLQVAGHEVLGWWIVNRPEDFERMTSEDASNFLGSAKLEESDEQLVLL